MLEIEQFLIESKYKTAVKVIFFFLTVLVEQIGKRARRSGN